MTNHFDDPLMYDVDGIGALRNPVMVVALAGWFDVAGAATTAVEALGAWRAPSSGSAYTFAEIDPDEFYDFTQERPVVEILDGEVRTITWPENHFDVMKGRGKRDLVLMLGVEPHIGWRTFAQCITRIATVTGCEAVVTVGAAAEAVPHTRVPFVTGSTSDPDLAARLGLSMPTYQGVTGLAGVLNAELEQLGVPAISLRVGIPHYLVNAEHPLAVSALQTHLDHVLGHSSSTDRREEIQRWRTLHDEVVDGDPQLRAYVRMLEHEFDRRAEASIPTADDLGEQFERYLREHRDDEPYGCDNWRDDPEYRDHLDDAADPIDEGFDGVDDDPDGPAPGDR